MSVALIVCILHACYYALWADPWILTICFALKDLYVLALYTHTFNRTLVRLCSSLCRLMAALISGRMALALMEFQYYE